MKKAPKKLMINRETIAKLEDEKLPKVNGGLGSDWMWGCSFQCPSSTGGFCDHIC